MEENIKETKRGINLHTIFSVLGIAITTLLLPILLINLTLIIRGNTDPSMPPSVFNITPMVVLSGSMNDGSYDAIEAGDLILVKKVDTKKLRENEVIAYMEGDHAVTHRIVKVNKEDGKVTYTTRGDANNTEDMTPVQPDMVIGQYFYRFAGIGDFVIFLQTPQGMACVIGIPLLIFAIYEVIRKYALAKKNKEKQEMLQSRIDDLKEKIEQAEAEEAETEAEPEKDAEPSKDAVVEGRVLKAEPSQVDKSPISAKATVKVAGKTKRPSAKVHIQTKK